MDNISHEYKAIAPYYERWSSGDAAYADSQRFYVHALSQFQEGQFLELGIGTGRISLAVLQQTPISIVGVDCCREMLEECRRRAFRQPLVGTLSLQEADFCRLSVRERFDGILLPFRTIGHLLTDQRLEQLFQAVFQALKPGGWFLFDHYMFQRAWAEQHNDVDILMYQGPGLTIQDHYRYDFEAGKMHCLVKVNGEIYESFDFRWLPVELLEKIIRTTGFQLVSRLGEFDGRPWTRDSLEQIWLLQKDGPDAAGRLPDLIRTNDRDFKCIQGNF